MYSNFVSVARPGESAAPASGPDNLTLATQEPAADAQPPVPQPPGPDNPPAAAQDGGVTIQVPGMATIVPLTRQQVNAIERRGEELSDQHRSALSRRNDVARELRTANLPADRAGLEERLKFLDQRILTLEQDIDANSSARASLEANYSGTGSSSSSSSSGSNSFSFNSSLGLLEIGVIVVISVAISRFLWRRSSRKMVQTATPQTDARFEQLEQAIDTVAIEIERVAEGQRFMTRMLREGQPLPDFDTAKAPDSVRVRSHQENES